MDERIKSMRDSYQKYLVAANAVLVMYESDGGRQKKGTTLALAVFRKQRDHFLSEFAEADRFVSLINRRVKLMESAEETEAMETSLENFNQVRNLLSSSYQTLARSFSVIAGQATKLDSEAQGLFLDELTEGRGGAHLTAASQPGCT